VEQVVTVDPEVVDEDERRLRAVDLGHRHGPVESHDRARGDRHELVVQRHDLPPVRGRLAVHGVDRRLDLVRPGPAASQAATYQLLALGDQLPVPEVVILVGEQDELAVR
jgi:hypothetical protein